MRPDERLEHQKIIVSNVEKAESIATRSLRDQERRDEGFREKEFVAPTDAEVEAAAILATCAVARAILARPA